MSRNTPTSAGSPLAGLGLASIIVGVLLTVGLSLYRELGSHGMNADAPVQATRAVLSSIRFRG